MERAEDPQKEMMRVKEITAPTNRSQEDWNTKVIRGSAVYGGWRLV